MFTSCYLFKQKPIEDNLGEIKEIPRDEIVEDSLKDNTPKIIFLNYNITTDSDNYIKAELINKIIAEGKLKNTDFKGAEKDDEDIICLQMDENSRIVDHFHINNPLVKDIEYVDSDGNLAKKKVELESTELSIRMQLNPHTKSILLQKIDAPNTKLSEIEL